MSEKTLTGKELSALASLAPRLNRGETFTVLLYGRPVARLYPPQAPPPEPEPAPATIAPEVVRRLELGAVSPEVLDVLSEVKAGRPVILTKNGFAVARVCSLLCGCRAKKGGQG